MGDTVRFGVSIDQELLTNFDDLINVEDYDNRSEAVRDMIRERLVAKEWEEGEEVVGVISLVYDHHKRNLSDKLTERQHQAVDRILASTHIHLDGSHCLEIIAVRGLGEEVKQLANDLIGCKGVQHGKLTATSTGEELV